VAGIASILVLATTGYGWNVMRDFSSGLTTSSALGGNITGDIEAGDLSGPQNILIMGLDSRRDQNGNPLPKAVLDQLHAGDSDNGGYNTNVLMLVHLPGGGGQPVGISIPRDDYVHLPDRPNGESKAKIKEAYGLAKAEAEQKLRGEGIRDQRQLERDGREAGRKAAIDTVQDFLGVQIDHFVEVTLVGFYDLAEALGKVTVCLQGPTQDSYSGARFGRGNQQLNAAQALAFVRQRRDYVHPGLNFTDLDRARRQQAFLASVAYQLSNTGTLANPSRLHALVGVAAKDVVIDSGFDLLAFGQQAPTLLNKGLSFTTLPVKAFDTVNGEAVNVVDPDEIKKVAHKLIDPDAPAEDTTEVPTPEQIPAATVDVTNTTGRDGLAATLANALVERGLTRGTLRTDHTPKAHTSLAYNPDVAGAADAVAQLLDDPNLTPRPDPNLAAKHLRLILGTDFTTPDDITTSPDAGTTTESPSAGVPATSLRTDGIPCVK
jgi:LCP family protein required for cell wall assembly